jgi:hypothetical protein
MSPALTDQVGTGISPPVRPSVWRVGWATFVGYLQTLLVGLPLAFGLLAVGINVFNGSSRGIFERYDVWSWGAEACAGLLATWITAFFVGESLRYRTEWEVPFSFTFLTLLLTGYAPVLALTPLYGAAAPVSLVAATLILRWRAEPAGAEPLKTLGAVPRRYRRKVAIGLAIAGPLMFAYVMAYGVTHPLSTADVISSEQKEWRFEPGKLHRYQLYIEDKGKFELSDFAIVGVEGSPALQLERVGIEASSWTVDDADHPMRPPLRPLGEYLPDSYAEDPITLELRVGKVCPGGVATLDAVRVRYTLLDGRHEQRLPLVHPPSVRCP